MACSEEKAEKWLHTGEYLGFRMMMWA